MSYNAALNVVYNHYLTAYAPKKSSTQYDSHKKSELRGIYNSIVKLNKDAPLYKLDNSKESRKFVIGLKENARSLRNTIASLGGLDEKEMLGKKAAYSTNESIADAAYIGEGSLEGAMPSFELEVTAMASNQVNLGSFLPSEERAMLAPGAYSFDISINDLNYEFQYNVHEGETNLDLQERLSRLVTNAEIGINADIVKDDNGNSSLRLASSATGLKNNKDLIFHVSDDKTSKRAGTVEYMGLDYIAREPSNAEFLLNGEPGSAPSNHFTIDKMFSVTLNGISTAEGETTQIGLKTDLDSLAENVNNLVDGYNSFIRAAAEYLDLNPRSGHLLNEMSRTSRYYQADLEKLGLSFELNGQLSLDEDTLKSSLQGDEGRRQFSAIKDFTNSVLRKTNQVSLNPIEYVNKTIVAYKNPGHNFPVPYMTSNYSGLLFNSYC